MNKSVWLARLLGIAGVLETVTALWLIVDPQGLASMLLGSQLEAPGKVIGRIAGGALLSIGIACWCARRSPSTPTGIGVAWGLFAYNVVACATLAWAAKAIAGSTLVAVSAVVLHGLFGVVLLALLILQKPPSPNY